jgi:hypothetical protein
VILTEFEIDTIVSSSIAAEQGIKGPEDENRGFMIISSNFKP